MLASIQKHINQKFSFLKDKKLLVAISGGIDSVVMTHLLHQSNFDISLAHCNFQLRDRESDLDEQFVKNLAKELNVKCFSISFETEDYAKKKKLSIQMAARELRYDWFAKILTKNKLDYILTAHQKDDVLETILINFTRGTGLDGLTGIPEINGNIIRPFLPFTRAEIENFATVNTIKWREDKSNASTKYFRNKIRHQVIPILKELNLSLMNSFDTTLENLKGSEQIIKDKIDEIRNSVMSSENNITKIDIDKIKNLSNPKAYLFELLKDYGFTEWNDVTDLLEAQSGKQIFGKTHRLVKDRAFLLLSEKIIETKNLLFEIQDSLEDFSNTNMQLKFETLKNNSIENNSKKTVCIDKDLLKFPLIVRKWEKGDYFCPAGMEGKKKLSKFFKDEKMSLLEKEETWLLCNSNNDIVWVIGKRLDNRFKITNNTKKSLKIKLQ